MPENTTSQLDLSTLTSDELHQLIEQAQALLEQRQAAEMAQSSDARTVKVEGIKIALDQSHQYVLAATPYHPDLVKEFRTLNGKWQASNSMWRFDARDEQRVRQMVTEAFGTDGGQPVEVVDVEMVLIGNQTNDNVRFALGREIVARPARDSRVRLGTGVTIVTGSFAGSGGSRNNPAIMRYGEEPVTVLVRDVPRVLAMAAVESDPEIYRIV